MTQECKNTISISIIRTKGVAHGVKAKSRMKTKKIQNDQIYTRNQRKKLNISMGSDQLP